MNQSEKITAHRPKTRRPLPTRPEGGRSPLPLSGIGPRDPGPDGIPGLQRSAAGNFTEFNFEAQCHSVFKNVRAVLEASGATWDSLVDVTVFLTNMQRDFHTYQTASTPVF